LVDREKDRESVKEKEQEGDCVPTREVDEHIKRYNSRKRVYYKKRKKEIYWMIERV